MGRRTLLLLASILVAAAATAMIWVYVQQADARAQSRWTARAVVLRATADLVVGSGYAEVGAATERVAVPQELLPEHPVTSADQLVGKAAVVPIARGSMLMMSQFQQAQAPADVPPGKVAVTVPLGDQARVAGLLHPGSVVAVYLVEPAQQQGQQATTGKTGAAGKAGTRGQAFVLIPSVTVKGLGSVTAARNGKGQPAQIGTQRDVGGGDVMLEATRDQAKQLILAANSGDVLWLTVLSSEKDAPRLGDSITLDQLLDISSAR